MATKKETFAKLAEASGREKRKLLEQILEENKAIAFILVRRFRQQWDLHHLPIEDFEQAACIGVLRAAESYRWGAGSTFSSWITDHVRQELQNLAHSMGHNVKRWIVPAAKIREIRAFEVRYGRAPSAAEVGIKDRQLARINEPAAQFELYDEAEDRDNGESHAHDLGEASLSETRMVLEQLTDQEQMIVSSLFNGDTEYQIAEEMGLSRNELNATIERIRGYFA